MKFNFGINWSRYVKKVVNKNVILQAKESLVKYLDEEYYRGKVFIDVGCGSGIFSLAAATLGCKKVISFDCDIKSIETTLTLRTKFEHLLPQNVEWIIFRGDILDESLVNSLRNLGDIVYCWGVLHHTGDMWRAIKNVCKIVAPSGILILAIYNRTPVSEIWLKIKKFYNNHKIYQPILGLLYGMFVCVGYMLKNKTFNLYRDRGMHVFYDAIDWLGGYPYEYASFDEIKNFVEKNGYVLIKTVRKLPDEIYIPTIFDILRAKNTGCNEFVFRRIL